ncbi:MAG: M48 family metallopeptidase [Novosphingobium sp.]|nr:M48 family metallopeptidase [Novosphingobium sp.]
MIDWLKHDPASSPSIDIGGRRLPIAIRRLAHARRMTLRLAPDGSEARISIPRWGRTQDAVDFAASRAEWLAGQLAAIPERKEIGNGSVLPYRGTQLLIEHAHDAPRRPSLGTGCVRIGGPAESMEKRLKRWLETEARTILPLDLSDYCGRAGKASPALALSNAQRRWGSCGPDGTIRINWRLIMAPDFVRRSVVAHEVAHLVHFDHSPRFHALLSDIFEGSVAEANSWLRRHGRTLYAPFG